VSFFTPAFPKDLDFLSRPVTYLTVSAAGLAADRPLFLRLELRATDSKELSAVMADPLGALVELFARKAKPGDPHWGPYQSGTFRLADLRVPGRGARNG